MERWEYEEQQTAVQREAREWLQREYPTNAFVTLTSRAESGISYKSMEKVFGTFAHGLKSYLFAPKSKKRTTLIPVVEGYDKRDGMAVKLGLRQGTHIHCLMHLPGNPTDHMEVVRRLWTRANPDICGNPRVYCPNSNNWFLPLDTPLKQRVFINYSLKTCVSDTDAVLWQFVPLRAQRFKSATHFLMQGATCVENSPTSVGLD